MEKIEFENQLLKAIKNDDLESFSLLMPTNAGLNLCFGRFPLLSVLYLYSSFRILSKYEKILMSIHNFQIVEESMSIYVKFKNVSGKILRLYQGEEIIYPIQMLAILDERIILKNNYKLLYKNVEITEKLANIYKIKHATRIRIEDNELILPPKKLTQRHYFWSGAFAFVSCIIIALSAIMCGFVSKKVGFGTEDNPIKVSSSNELSLALDTGGRVYALTNDLTVSCMDSIDKFNGVLDGQGYTLTIEGVVSNSFITNLKGTIKNLKIKLTNNEIKITQNDAILVQNNNGIIDNCEIFGDFVMKYDSQEETFAGLFASNNLGVISNCAIDASGTISNSQESNAYFGAFSGINSEAGQIVDCVTKEGVMIANTVDLAGFAGVNYGTIKNSNNKVHISQTSAKMWHPNVAGIAVANYGTIEICVNYAELSSKSEVNVFEEKPFYVLVAGISCDNYGNILSCRNNGKILGQGDVSNVVIGGITAQNIKNSECEGLVKLSLNDSHIKGYSEQAQVCVGGVVGTNSSVVLNSGSLGTIEAESKTTKNEPIFMNKVDKTVAVVSGGVVGVNQNALVQNSYSDMNFICGVEAENVLKIYSGVIGSIGMYKFSYLLTPGLGMYYQDAYRYIAKNYYVAREEIKQIAYGVDAILEQRNNGVYYYSGIAEALPDAGYELFMKKCASFNEIPQEVKINA